MNDDTKVSNYLAFDEEKNIESVNQTEAEEKKEDDITLSPEDFAKLARKASGYTESSNSNNLDIENEPHLQSVSKEEEKKNIDSFANEEERKIIFKSPYLKIIVGLLLTSSVIAIFIFFRSSYSRITTLSQNKDVNVKEDRYAVDPKSKENEDLRAQLASIEQNRENITPKPELKPQSEPEPRPEPRPEPKSPPASSTEPEPEPEPEPIDPYQQWEMLSKLGTLGNSASLPQQGELTKTTQTFNQVQKSDRTEHRRIAYKEASPNAIASASLDNLNLSSNESTFYQNDEGESAEPGQKDRRNASQSRGARDLPFGAVPHVSRLAKGESAAHSSAPSPQSSSSTSELPFSSDSRNIILSGLGVSGYNKVSAGDKKTTGNPRQISIGQTVEGKLANTITWTNSLNTGEMKGVVSLTEPLEYNDGTIALPIGSSIIFEIDRFDPAGFITLNAIAIVRSNSKKETLQQEIPINTLLIRGEDNRPIEFETDGSDDNNSRVSQVIGGVVQGGVRGLPVPRNVSSELSRVVTGSGSSRSQQEFYSIKAGTPISIYVNDSIQFAQ